MNSLQNKSHKIKKIIWAIDAYQEMDKMQQNIIDTINAVAQHSPIKPQVEPVYVLGTNRFTLPELSYPQPEVSKNEISEDLKAKLNSTNITNLMPPQILESTAFSSTKAAKALINYAHESNADLIVTGTHARHGFPRLFLGSFAESLILYSSVPVLSVSNEIDTTQGFKHILFPSDLQEESQAVFPKVLEFAQDLECKITVLHLIPKPLLLLPKPQMISTMGDYIKQQRIQSHKMSQYFIEQAQNFGVSMRIEMPTTTNPISEAILKFAKKNHIQLIAMAARSGRLVSAVAGSTTRQIVRSSSYPVWVLREKKISEQKPMAA